MCIVDLLLGTKGTAEPSILGGSGNTGGNVSQGIFSPLYHPSASEATS